MRVFYFADLTAEVLIGRGFQRGPLFTLDVTYSSGAPKMTPSIKPDLMQYLIFTSKDSVEQNLMPFFLPRKLSNSVSPFLIGPFVSPADNVAWCGLVTHPNFGVLRTSRFTHNGLGFRY